MLCSLNYHHEGDSKTWYGISNADAPKFKTITSKNLFPQISGKEPHHVWAINADPCYRWGKACDAANDAADYAAADADADADDVEVYFITPTSSTLDISQVMMMLRA
jgi:hypothetical protein